MGSQSRTPPRDWTKVGTWGCSSPSPSCLFFRFCHLLGPWTPALSRPCFMDLSPPGHCIYSESSVRLLVPLCLSWKSLFGLPRVSDSSASHMWDCLGSSDKLHEVKGKGEAPLSPLGLGWRLNKSQTFLQVNASSPLGACSSQLRVAYEFYHPDVESRDEG